MLVVLTVGLAQDEDQMQYAESGVLGGHHGLRWVVGIGWRGKRIHRDLEPGRVPTGFRAAPFAPERSIPPGPPSSRITLTHGTRSRPQPQWPVRLPTLLQPAMFQNGRVGPLLPGVRLGRPIGRLRLRWYCRRMTQIGAPLGLIKSLA